MNLRKRGEYSNRLKRQRENKSNMAAYAGVITYIISLGIRIFLSRVIGDAGVGLLSPAFELFTLITLFFSYGISRAMTGLIRYRVKREQYKNARKVFHMSFKLSILISVLSAVILASVSGFISETLVLETMSSRAILAVAPVIILSALINVFRGYFNGNGFGVLVAHSHYIEKIAMLIASVAISGFFMDYGWKVAALRHNDIEAYSYGAFGAVIGIMLAEIVTVIYLLVVFLVYSGTWKRQLNEDVGRRMESNGSIAGTLIGNSIPMALLVIISNAFMFIDQRFFNYCMVRSELEGTKAELWGSYYGKFAVLIGIGAALACLSVLSSVGKIVNAHEREEYHMMRERMDIALKRLCVYAFPIAINLAVLAEAFVNGLYEGDNAQMISLVRLGTVIVFFYGVAYLFGQVMLKTRMTKEFLISLAVSFLAHIAAIFMLVREKLMGLEGIVCSVIIFTGIMAVLCVVLTCRKMKYRPEWLYSFAFPAVSASLSGLVVLMICKLLLNEVGGILTIIISSLIGLTIYILLLMVLRVLNEAEISGLPLGKLWISLGRMIGVL